MGRYDLLVLTLIVSFLFAGPAHCRYLADRLGTTISLLSRIKGVYSRHELCEVDRVGWAVTAIKNLVTPRCCQRIRKLQRSWG